MVPTKLFAIAVLCALAITAVPLDDAPVVGSAEAYLCVDWGVECQLRQAECYVGLASDPKGACPL